MAELSDTATPRTTASPVDAPPDRAAAPADQTALHTERALRARIAELEALVEARTQVIVGMGARLAELQGDAPPSTSARLREAESQLAQLRATKLVRYAAVPRHWYGRTRRAVGRLGRLARLRRS